MAIEARARNITLTDDTLSVDLTDGRTIQVPLDWFPTLRRASEKQRSNWRLIGNGIGIHWDELDEDLSVHGLLNPSLPNPASRPSVAS